MNSAIQQRIAIAAASILLAVAIVLVAVRAGDDEATVALPSPTATATATAKPAAASPKATSTAARTPAPTVRAAATPAPTDVPTPTTLARGQAVPPKPGTYRYRESTDGETSESTFHVADEGSGRYTESFDGELANDVVWRSNGKFVESTTFGDPPGAGFECDWNPDVRELKLPFATGSAWSFSGKCTPAPGVSLELKGTSRVTGTQPINVGGKQVETWAFNTNATLTFTTPDESGTQRVSSQERFAAEYGLYVRSVEKSAGKDPQTGQNVNETTTRELVSLTPS